MNHIIIMGPPFAGKDTIASLLVKNFGLHQIGTGKILREEQEAGTKIGRMADRLINSGGFIPDDVIIPMVKDRIIKYDGNVGLLFNGFPRTKEQAKQLHGFLHMRKSPIKGVIYLSAQENILKERMLHRAKTEGRADDNEQAFINRMNEYHSKTAPLLEFFAKLGLIHRIDSNDPVDEVYLCVETLVKNWLSVPA